MNITFEEERTPACVRALRLKAGLTKLEAARCIGLAAAVTWHGYETGRFSMPQWRWKEFLSALRSGEYARHITAPAPGRKRNGPRCRQSFTPGEHAHAKPAVALIDGAGRYIKRVRQAIRVSPREIAQNINGASASLIYALEASGKPASRDLLQSVSNIAIERAKELERMTIEVENIDQLNSAIAALRTTQAEVGGYLYPDAKRPGAMISHFARGSLELDEGKRAAINAALEDIRSRTLLAVSAAILEVESAIA